ncbi:MAG: protoporphyrinogen oxidase [Thermoflavifilum sp.]|nr:protoporphyrinogen oxidase [Thermoflavifilum sp.]
MAKQVIILGAGITGLSLGYFLQQKGIPFLLLEKEAQIGGHIRSYRVQDYLIDAGPNTLQGNQPIVKQLIQQLRLENELLFAPPQSAKRYIVKGGKLHPLPLKPQQLLRSRLLSFSAKLQLLREPWIKPTTSEAPESIAQFISRRLGAEWVDYVVNPFVAGVFAGDPQQLDTRFAFPILYQMEKSYGSLLKGLKQMAASRNKQHQSNASEGMFSFRSGMQVLPETLAQQIREQLRVQTKVIQIRPHASGWEVIYEELASGKQIAQYADILVSTLPAYALAEILGEEFPMVKKHLSEIIYPPVLTYFLAYPLDAIPRPLDGFGFLVPEKEKLSFLGAIWTSVLFPQRAPAHQAAFTLFLGGMRHRAILGQEKHWMTTAQSEFEAIMGIQTPPVFSFHQLWRKAIPQYDLDYSAHEGVFSQFEHTHPGIFLAGNYRGGISVGHCIRSAHQLAERIAQQI